MEKLKNIIETDRAKQRISALMKREYLPAGVVKRLGEGAFGEVYSVGDPPEYVVKLFKKDGLAFSEVLALKEMAKRNFSVRVPEVYGITRDEAGDVVRMSFLDGVPMDRIRLNRKNRRRAAKEIAAAVSGFSDDESCGAEDVFFGELSGKKYDSWEAFYQVKAKTLLFKAKKLFEKGLLGAKTLRVMEDAFRRFDDIFAGKKIRRAFVHGDLNPENIMLRTDGSLSGFYDPIGSMYGDSEYELFQLDTNGGKRYRILKEYKKIVPFSETYPLKRDFYRLFAEVGYYFDTNLEESAQIRRWAASLRKNSKRFLK